jgi:hypothetical protein
VGRDEHAALALALIFSSNDVEELGDGMFEVTWPDGRKAQINGTSVVRIRRSVAGEGGNTRIDLQGVRYQLVTETPDEIAKLTKAELPTLASIHSLDTNSVWFNAKSVIGPVYITPFEREGTAIRSALLIFAPKKQYTLETAAQVADIIRAAGGTPEPLPPEDGLMATFKNWVGSVFGSKTLIAPDLDDGPPGAVLDQ